VHELAELREPLRALGQVAAVDPPARDQALRERVQERHVRTRTELHEDIRDLRELDPARVDHDQPRAAPKCLLQARTDHRMRLGRVRADHDDQPRALDVVVAGARGARAGGEAGACNRRGRRAR
jgi:hypothetical protein